MNRLSRNTLIIVLLGGIFVGAGLFVRNTDIFRKKITPQSLLNIVQSTQSSNESLSLNAHIISPQGVNISVRVANTDKTRELGLSYFKSLPDGQGMLFVFPQMGIYSFWMKDMNFPLDIVWIDDNFNIIDRVINVSSSSYPESFISSGLARYVLEIPANTADRDGLLVGKKILLQQDKE